MKLKKIILSGVFIALCLVLPFFTGQIPQIGSILSPMHIPVLISGFVLGSPYSLIIGFISPLLRSALTGGFPPMFPTAFAMAFELSSYGFFTSLFSKMLPKGKVYVYFSLILSMLLGRIVWGAVMYIISCAGLTAFGFATFISAAFINSAPGIICHLVIVPIVVSAIENSVNKND